MVGYSARFRANFWQVAAVLPSNGDTIILPIIRAVDSDKILVNIDYRQYFIAPIFTQVAVWNYYLSHFLRHVVFLVIDFP